jgi:hypothetical protein
LLFNSSHLRILFFETDLVDETPVNVSDWDRKMSATGSNDASRSGTSAGIFFFCTSQFWIARDPQTFHVSGGGAG